MDNLDKTENYTVRDMSLAEQGTLRVDWARARMPVMAKIKEEAEKEERKRMEAKHYDYDDG